MTNKESGLDEQIAEALGLEKGGITEHPSPTNEHYYYVNEVIDYDTDEVMITQRINFMEQINSIKALIVTRERAAQLALLERLEMRIVSVGTRDAINQLRTELTQEETNDAK